MAPDDSAEAIEIRLVLEAIHARYGYDFRGYAADSIARRVKATLAKSGFAHLGELQHRLLTEPSLFKTIMEGLTVQVSGMFRTPAFYRAFRNNVVPILRTYPRLKIWHAGCATGEEVYATAIVLAEEGLLARTQIYATDISEAALEHAREGVYSNEVLEEAIVRYSEAGGTGTFEQYCARGYGRVAMRQDLRRNAVFFRHDLVNDYSLGEMNVVFCRNVMIYFGVNLRERVLDMFARDLAQGGFLCLGASEGLPASKVPAFGPFAPSERIYRHRGES
ncbi:MAG TPA: protein-glutamate O-methyltransferase CheR [Polyangiaceae bacterium]|jgi:chemotaxis protein methyltransferase CheR|nr:protein-glutamate O-methyltransferase CheR [Polyangiaceae bacterium]